MAGKLGGLGKGLDAIFITDTQYPAYPVGEKIPEVTVM